jgi:hypothetical protein
MVGLQMNESVYRGIQCLATVQEVQFHNEDIFNDLSLALLDQFTSGTSRTTSGNQIINNDNTGTGLDGALLDLKDILN